MTTLDDIPWPPPEPANPAAPPPRRHRHVWVRELLRNASEDPAGDLSAPPAGEWRCFHCDKPRDDTAVRRGRAARRLGGDQERRARDRYGFEKVGQFGGITDLRGATKKVQQKASRRPAPPRWVGIFRALDTVADGRTPAILLSFVRVGVGTEDFFIIRGSDWLDLFGRDEREAP